MSPDDSPRVPSPPPLAEEGVERLPTQQKKKQQFRREKRDVHGWVVLDKAIGMTSTKAVGAIKRLFSCKRAGHAGTLDPLASGCLPIALGEATKTVPFVMDGRKTYSFTVRWGEERDTDDADGRVAATSEKRPDLAAIEALLPAYTGTISQVPPQYSAIKVEGERAYDLARDGETVDLQARPVEIHRLALTGMPDADTAEFEAECGKGTYVRVARPGYRPGRSDGYGHIKALRREAVGGFSENDMISLEQLTSMCHRAAAGEASLADALLPVETALDDIPALAVSRAGCGKASKRPSRFVARTGCPHLSRHGLCHGLGPVGGPGRKWTAARSSPSACSTWPGWWGSRRPTKGH